MMSDIIKKLRKEKRLTQMELAERLNVSQSTIASWENGKRRPDLDLIPIIADFFGVSADLLYDRAPETPKLDQVPQKSVKPGQKEYISIPVLGSIPAGIPFEAIEDIIDWEDLAVEDTAPGKKYFGLKIKGDSMEPEYRSGDTIIVQQQVDCNSGDDCVVMVNGYDATFKRVRLQENGLTLQPLNSKYEPRFFNAKEIQDLPVRILGVVVEIRRNLRK